VHSGQWQDILTLLCMVVLADKKVYQEEVEAFQTAAISLKDKYNPDVMLTHHMLKDWFLLNRDELTDLMDRPEYGFKVRQLTNNLRDRVECADIASAFMKVSISDGHQHRKENDIIRQACQNWGVPLPIAI